MNSLGVSEAGGRVGPPPLQGLASSAWGNIWVQRTPGGHRAVQHAFGPCSSRNSCFCTAPGRAELGLQALDGGSLVLCRQQGDCWVLGQGGSPPLVSAGMPGWSGEHVWVPALRHLSMGRRHKRRQQAAASRELELKIQQAAGFGYGTTLHGLWQEVRAASRGCSSTRRLHNLLPSLHPSTGTI